MFTRSLQRALHHVSSPSATTVPPAFLLPFRAHLTTTTTTTTTDPAPPSAAYNHQPQKHTPTYVTPSPPPPPSPQRQRHPQLPRSPLPPPTNPPNLHLLPLLAAQPPHYIVLHIHARSYLLTLGDTLRLPFHMPSAPPGTILRLNRATMLGSRDYTYRGDPWVDETRFLCRAVVVAVEGEPLRQVVKTVRRNRRVRIKKNKMQFTVLRITGLEVLPEGMKVQEEEVGEELEERDVGNEARG
ncbi:hypothetical protein JMJ35_006593 [Cladonia borealis]|uniref:Large ribosomal subunit protein bL21m n=1 Tax=Cladonia borealis TaxID=184061 RepID=A0AA39R078_9LECA|nr:hypothetical protein JMJ35_006593 [Cladonia borealis]